MIAPPELRERAKAMKSQNPHPQIHEGAAPSIGAGTGRAGRPPTVYLFLFRDVRPFQYPGLRRICATATIRTDEGRIL